MVLTRRVAKAGIRDFWRKRGTRFAIVIMIETRDLVIGSAVRESGTGLQGSFLSVR